MQNFTRPWKECAQKNARSLVSKHLIWGQERRKITYATHDLRPSFLDTDFLLPNNIKLIFPYTFVKHLKLSNEPHNCNTFNPLPKAVSLGFVSFSRTLQFLILDFLHSQFLKPIFVSLRSLRNRDSTVFTFAVFTSVIIMVLYVSRATCLFMFILVFVFSPVVVSLSLLIQ